MYIINNSPVNFSIKNIGNFIPGVLLLDFENMPSSNFYVRDENNVQVQVLLQCNYCSVTLPRAEKAKSLWGLKKGFICTKKIAVLHMNCISLFVVGCGVLFTLYIIEFYFETKTQLSTSYIVKGYVILCTYKI